MLSYRHAFHAGNHADVLKHLTQVLILESLLRKDKAFFYLDTHAGAGLYDLRSAESDKTGEFREGIARLLEVEALPAVLQSYLAMIREMNPVGALIHYPGSPWVAKQLLRAQDRACLCELHPTDFGILRNNFAGARQFRVEQQDGFQQLKALLPPPERRGLVLIDPPYEIKTDYERVVKAVAEGVKRFATGIYAIWYPVVSRAQIDALEQGFKASGVKRILLAELNVQADSDEYGMTGSGMIVVNPPWQLDDKLAEALPFLTDVLGQSAEANWRLQWLAGEA